LNLYRIPDAEMRIAVFSDVHGNLTALEAVLADINRQAVDTMVFAGDLCAIGPRPAECLRMVREQGVLCIYGNTDAWTLGRQEPPERLKAIAGWTNQQLSDDERAWLNALPFALRYQRTNIPADALHIVHANPCDVNQIIFPPENEQIARYKKIRQADGEIEPLLAGLEAAVLVFGHLHIPNVRTLGNLRLANISSVSVPGDGDPRAKYAIFTWTGGAWQMEMKRVSYDMAAEVAAYKSAQPPGWEQIVEMILKEGYFAQSV
jgi:putative phosphoesterase